MFHRIKLIRSLTAERVVADWTTTGNQEWLESFGTPPRDSFSGIGAESLKPRRDSVVWIQRIQRTRSEERVWRGKVSFFKRK